MYSTELEGIRVHSRVLRSSTPLSDTLELSALTPEKITVVNISFPFYRRRSALPCRMAVILFAQVTSSERPGGLPALKTEFCLMPTAAELVSKRVKFSLDCLQVFDAQTKFCDSSC